MEGDVDSALREIIVYTCKSIQITIFGHQRLQVEKVKQSLKPFLYVRGPVLIPAKRCYINMYM